MLILGFVELREIDQRVECKVNFDCNPSGMSYLTVRRMQGIYLWWKYENDIRYGRRLHDEHVDRYRNLNRCNVCGMIVMNVECFIIDHCCCCWMKQEPDNGHDYATNWCIPKTTRRRSLLASLPKQTEICCFSALQQNKYRIKANSIPLNLDCRQLVTTAHATTHPHSE